MGLLANILENIAQKKSTCVIGNRSNFIFYKIVDFDPSEDIYKLQCINTRPTFDAKISDIVFDLDILFGLHPIQACFIGIEYGKSLQQFNSSNPIKDKVHKISFTQYSTSRYGNYQLDYQTRKGELGFTHQITKEKYLMDPRDIALSEDLIRDFDASQAFYIGLLAGRKMDASAQKHANFSSSHKPVHLRVIK
jgi:hypothetical protein